MKRLPGCACPPSTWPGFAQRLAWSPDESMIAYSGGTGPDPYPSAGIYVEKVDGSASVRVAYSPAVQYSRPLWRRQGDRDESGRTEEGTPA